MIPPAEDIRPLSSIAILGTDALLAALPATPVQLANACFAGGYEAVFPASWGDELIAARCLEAVASRGDAPAILCACPHVAKRLGDDPALRNAIIAVVSAPVAAARYIRAQHRALGGDAHLHLTYVGSCPGANDPSIDHRITPAELLAELAEHGVYADAQPSEFGENRLGDRRRFYSLPGGVPTREALAMEGQRRTLVEPDPIEFLASFGERLTARERVLINLAPQLGCACSGSMLGAPRSEARKAVVALEPPRAEHEVLDHGIRVEVRMSAVASASVARRAENARHLPATRAAGTSARSSYAQRASGATPTTRQSQGQGWVRPGAYWARQALRDAAPRPGMMPKSRSSETRPAATLRPLIPQPSAAQDDEDAWPPHAPVASSTPRSDRWRLIGASLVVTTLVAAITSAITVREMMRSGGEAGQIAQATPLPTPPMAAAAHGDPRPATRVTAAADLATAAEADSAAAPPLRPLPLGSGDVMRVAAAPLPRHVPRTVVAHLPSPHRMAAARLPDPAPPRAPDPVPTVFAPSDRGVNAPAPAAQPAPLAPVALATPAPAADSSAAHAAAPPVDVAAELKAIHEEIELRKRRIDSLARALGPAPHPPRE